MLGSTVEIPYGIHDEVYVVQKESTIIKRVVIDSIHISLYIGMTGLTCQQTTYNKGKDSFCLGGMAEGIYNAFPTRELAVEYITANL